MSINSTSGISGTGGRTARASVLPTLVLVLALGTALVPASTALAEPAGALDSVQSFRNAATSACLDDSDAGVRTYTCLGNDHQKWNVHQWKDGTRELRNVKTGFCLADNPRGTATHLPCDKHKDESWIVHRYADGAVEFRNQATGLCLDDSFEAGLRTFPCGSHEQKSAYQTWR
ncbi:RICIN domain-containing protein [Streptomyces sp. NPDC059917]|uniref:RICIN domain-containing protein n=1 Tax=Streptomyces sp. NPDC059917 TaxID=3347002 RepID=UPI00365BF884